ncbi:PLP-dependent aminotransferase family protein [Taibaiella chishuiensis]|uniref:GntR family transcriptional regulator/MocR family aminotransferase n=1 Tax=Taibaiella chishuiensis TaxID=1434707 RepID=A0A2P8CXR3_9BACT|nr:PLP-dependent aminotransferase family protein [Taibaiella chishuiensis]PSK89763.1 GntR family transcriptional regulator/MocR family aminotransferase [Taibaiella chishuiensis]
MLRPWKTILSINLDCEKAVYQQIADGIVDEIRKGRLRPGMPLPGTRVLADDIGVNRKTIVTAYTELIDEGWLSTAYKKGTFVAETLPEADRSRKKRPAQTPPAGFDFIQHQSIAITPGTKKTAIVFDDGWPDVHLAPLDDLARAYKRIFQQKTRWRMMGYSDARGEERLRHALSAMLHHDRGLNAGADQVCITRGSQMALYLTARTLVQPGDVVAIETPGYPPAFQAFQTAGAEMYPVSTDEQGICATVLEALCRQRRIKAVYVTPHHQFPTTVSMKADRRLQLIALSNQYGFAIVEDDYDHDYHFGIRSLLPLASMDNGGNIIYIGSLSKLIAPAVRVGYVAAPAPFIESLAALRYIIDRQGDPVMEHAVAELMEEGVVRRHARKALTIYRQRRLHMDAQLQQHLGKQVHYQMPEGGLAYWVNFRKPVDTVLLAQRLEAQGVQVSPPGRCAFDGSPLHALRLGYASLTEARLAEGIGKIARVLQRL